MGVAWVDRCLHCGTGPQSCSLVAAVMAPASTYGRLAASLPVCTLAGHPPAPMFHRSNHLVHQGALQKPRAIPQGSVCLLHQPACRTSDPTPRSELRWLICCPPFIQLSVDCADGSATPMPGRAALPRFGSPTRGGNQEHSKHSEAFFVCIAAPSWMTV